MIKVVFCLPRSIRVKLNTSCQLRCKFCHQEGYADSADIKTEELINALSILKKEFGFYRVHFTGGEPTLYNKFGKLLNRTKKLGFLNALTTNGQFKIDELPRFKKAGLNSINFSLHTLNPYDFLRLQNISLTKKERLKWADKCINNTIKNILIAKNLIKNTKVNCVVSKDLKGPIAVLDFCMKNKIKLRFLNDLTLGNVSLNNIRKILFKKKAELVGHEITMVSSSHRLDYEVDGYKFGVKCIRPFFVKTLCNKCNFKETNKCLEGFYGIRLENSPLMVRLCLNKNNFPYVQSFLDFLESPQFREIKEEMRDAIKYLRKDSLIKEQKKRYHK